MVLLGRIELPTSSLPMTRSTTELQQPVMPRAASLLRRGGRKPEAQSHSYPQNEEIDNAKTLACHVCFCLLLENVE